MKPFINSTLKKVTDSEMEAIYQQIKTPFKYGAVMKMEDDLTDSPSVFFHNGKWYMYFISISKDCSVSGYETHLAVSDDLLNWEKINTIFCRDDKNRWDSKQCAGYAALMDIDFGGTNSLSTANGKYYISYLAGNSDGYEPDPLYMGLAYSSSPLEKFEKSENPILKPEDEDAREHETKTLYKSFIFEDKEKITGHNFVNVYNAKHDDDTERIFLAVSDDCENWERYGDKPIIDDIVDEPNLRISGDPQIAKIGDIYIMFYFKHDPEGKTYDTFACSRDLINWNRWKGEPLVIGSEDWDNVFAHKPWVIKHNDIVYHYYCACNTNGERFIAVATSKNLKI